MNQRQFDIDGDDHQRKRGGGFDALCSGLEEYAEDETGDSTSDDLGGFEDNPIKRLFERRD